MLMLKLHIGNILYNNHVSLILETSQKVGLVTGWNLEEDFLADQEDEVVLEAGGEVVLIEEDLVENVNLKDTVEVIERKNWYIFLFGVIILVSVTW